MVWPRLSSLFPLLALLMSLVFSFYMSMLPGGGRRHSSLSSTVVRRVQSDAALLDRTNEHPEWYTVNMSRIASDLFKSKFVMASMDEESYAFVEQSVTKSSWLFTQLWHNVAKTFLMYLFRYTKTDANGYLRRGSMFVLSKEQVGKMMDNLEMKFDSRVDSRLIDLGAGDGEAGQPIYKYFEGSILHATEASPVMRSILATKSIKVLEIEDWFQHTNFDVIMCFNLIDRCDKPLTLLHQMHTALTDNGILLLAAVLPFKPYVELTSDHKPTERLKIRGKGFEEQTESLAKLLQNNGFNVLSWTRVPYLSEGDLVKSVYSLNNAVFVLNKRKGSDEADKNTESDEGL